VQALPAGEVLGVGDAVAEEYADGMATTWTASAPSASRAMVATTAESIPPDRPSTTDSKPFLAT
jgi:hypothetical protein